MQSVIEAVPKSKSKLWAGRIATAIPVLFLLLDAIIKFVKPAPVIDSFARLGYPISVAVGLGIVILVCTALYVLPITSVLGAILLTGYLGGAVATHLRVGDPLFSHVLFPVYLGVLVWAGLFLRDERLRTLIPVRSSLAQ